MSNYVDDNNLINWNLQIEELIIDMKKSLEAITKWLRDSGLKVNKVKNKICLFLGNITRSIDIPINDVTLKSAPVINFFKVRFDSQLKWTQQVANTV